MFVLVLDKNRKPLDPCHPARARKFLEQGRAVVIRRYPFTIMLKDVEVSTTQEYRLKLDPGSKTTGIAIVRGEKVVWAAELNHRLRPVSVKMESLTA